jgi:hypothetical protein
MKDKTLQMRRPNATAKRPYDSAYVPGIGIHATLKRGVNWYFYKGRFPWLPQVAGLKAAKHGVLKEISLPVRLNNEGVLLYEGLISVPDDGTYTFNLKSGGNALLRIHDAVVIDADHNYQSGKKYQSTMCLAKGLHPFRLYYRCKANDTRPVPDLRWSGPGIPDSSLLSAYVEK